MKLKKCLTCGGEVKESGKSLHENWQECSESMQPPRRHHAKVGVWTAMVDYNGGYET